MERRLVERYAMALAAEVRPVGLGPAVSAGCAATVRDISSHGVSFHSERTWEEGQMLAISVDFDNEVAQPYSYRLSVHGRIVRTGRDKRTARRYWAVAFTDSASIRDWREIHTGGGR